MPNKFVLITFFFTDYVNDNRSWVSWNSYGSAMERLRLELTVSKALPIVVTVAILFCSVSSATNHTVGGNSGWDLTSNLQAWTSETTFHVGDSLGTLSNLYPLIFTFFNLFLRHFGFAWSVYSPKSILIIASLCMNQSELIDNLKLVTYLLDKNTL